MVFLRIIMITATKRAYRCLLSIARRTTQAFAKNSPPDNQCASRHLVPDEGGSGDRIRQCNALVFISVLPSELLAQIFSEYVSQFHPEDYVYHPGTFHLKPLPQGPGYYAWIVISHVCSHWRTVAIDESTLWGRILLQPSQRIEAMSECIRTMLMRSKWAMLDVTMDFRGFSGMCLEQRDITSVLAELRRIKALRIHGDAGQFLNVVYAAPQEFISREAPNLRTLVIDGVGWNHRMERSSLPPYDPFRLTGEWVRNLQSIEIISSGGSFPWGHPVPFSGLKYLKLGPDAWCKSAGEDVLRTLEQLPLLETLSLRLRGPQNEQPPTGSASQQSPTVSLRKLQSILLAGIDEYCMDILDHLSVPPQAIISLKFSGYPETNLDRWIRGISAKLEGIMRPVSMVISGERRGSVRILGSTDDPYSSHSSEGPCKVYYNLDMTSQGFDLHMWETFCTSPLVSQVKILDLSNLHPGLFHFRLGSFRYMGDVEIVRLHLFDSKRVQALLGQREDIMPEAFIFPRLRVLTMDRVLFEDQTSSETFRAVADCLIQRYQNNIAITHLILTNCINLDEHAVAVFRELVPMVSWDGNVNLEDAKFGLPMSPRRQHGHRRRLPKSTPRRLA